jgi:hypothetical protein
MVSLSNWSPNQRATSKDRPTNRLIRHLHETSLWLIIALLLPRPKSWTMAGWIGWPALSVPMRAKKKKEKPVDRRRFNRPPPAPEGNKYAEGNDGGRPTSFRPQFVDQARQLCQLGATDVEVARFFKVHPCTIYEWRATIPEFSEALRIGKSLADERMKRSLYQRGIGYDYRSIKTEERVVGKTLKPMTPSKAGGLKGNRQRRL